LLAETVNLAVCPEFTAVLPGVTEPPALAVVVMMYAVTAVVEAEDEPPPQATSAEQR
jgi:hypothetical protein